MNAITIESGSAIDQAADKAARIAAAVAKRNNEILRLLAAGEEVIDDHSHAKPFVAQAVALLGNDLVPLFANYPYYSLNGLELKDGKVHLSTYGISTMAHTHGTDFEKTVKMYNARMVRSPWPGDEMTNLVVF